MSIAAPINSYIWSVTNSDVPTASPGTSVVPGTSGSEGSWTEILTAANMANEGYGLYLFIGGGSTSATAKNHLLDIGVDPAAGTAYVAILSDIVCGQSTPTSNGGIFFFFPIHIPAGSTVAARIQGSSATAGTVRVTVTVVGRPTHPEVIRQGKFSETIGAIASSIGVAVTPGVSAAEGAWASLGTTAKNLWFFQLCVGINNGTVTQQVMLFDLAWGDASNKHLIIVNLMLLTPTSNETVSLFLQPDGYCEVPAGATIYARCSTSLATADTGTHAVAVGIGG